MIILKKKIKKSISKSRKQEEKFFRLWRIKKLQYQYLASMYKNLFQLYFLMVLFKNSSFYWFFIIYNLIHQILYYIGSIDIPMWPYSRGKIILDGIQYLNCTGSYFYSVVLFVRAIISYSLMWSFQCIMTKVAITSVGLFIYSKCYGDITIAYDCQLMH